MVQTVFFWPQETGPAKFGPLKARPRSQRTDRRRRRRLVRRTSQLLQHGVPPCLSRGGMCVQMHRRQETMAIGLTSGPACRIIKGTPQLEAYTTDVIGAEKASRACPQGCEKSARPQRSLRVNVPILFGVFPRSFRISKYWGLSAKPFELK